MLSIPFRRPGLPLHGSLSLVAALTLLALVLVVAAGCGSSQSGQSGDFGPLAVTESPGGGPDAHGGTGPVHIGDTCVTTTRENGEALLLVWNSAEVRWDAKDREITFTRPPGSAAKPITIRAGDIITVGGGALVGDVPVERDLPWLATPREACSGDQWAVSSVTRP